MSMLQSLNIVPSADGGTLRFELNGGSGVMLHAAVFAARYRGGAVDICYKADNEVLFSVMPADLTLAGGAPFADAATAVTALNAVIGAGLGSGGAGASTAPPSLPIVTDGTLTGAGTAGSPLSAQPAVTGLDNKIETEKTTRANADTTLQTNINNETSARQAADAALQTALAAILGLPAVPASANKTYGLTASTNASGNASFQWVELNGEWLLG